VSHLSFWPSIARDTNFTKKHSPGRIKSPWHQRNGSKSHSKKETAVRVRQTTAVSYLQNYNCFVTWFEEASLLTPSLVTDLTATFTTWLVNSWINISFRSYQVETANHKRKQEFDTGYIGRYITLNVRVPSFRVKNDLTIRACKKQKEERVVHSAEVHGGTDPHKGLRYLMSDKDQENIYNNIYRHINDWDSLITSSSREQFLCSPPKFCAWWYRILYHPTQFSHL
jgi:hypothetical protein